jgi:hypothetical protein
MNADPSAISNQQSAISNFGERQQGAELKPCETE